MHNIQKTDSIKTHYRNDTYILVINSVSSIADLYGIDVISSVALLFMGELEDLLRFILKLNLLDLLEDQLSGDEKPVYETLV